MMAARVGAVAGALMPRLAQPDQAGRALRPARSGHYVTENDGR